MILDRVVVSSSFRKTVGCSFQFGRPPGAHIVTLPLDLCLISKEFHRHSCLSTKDSRAGMFILF